MSIAVAERRLLVLTVALALGAGCSREPGAEERCTLPLAGSYAVVAHTVDPDGCTEGAPDTSLAQFSMLSCDAPGTFMLSTANETGCVRGARKVAQLDSPNECSGGSLVSASIDRADSVEVCTTFYERIEATLDGDELVVELRQFSHAEPAAPDGSCPDFSNWTRGENLPPCERRERLVGQRVR